MPGAVPFFTIITFPTSSHWPLLRPAVTSKRASSGVAAGSASSTHRGGALENHGIIRGMWIQSAAFYAAVCAPAAR